MRKVIAVFLAIFLLSTNTAFAGAFTKLGRGLTNVLTAKGEYIVQIADLYQDNDPFTALFGGIVKGTVMMIGREFAGLYDIITFPIPFPSAYRPLWQPPTVVDALRELKD